MQDIHLVDGGGSGERRLRPHQHHPSSNQALKCPRCDSSNTKFCYYNNYNLSQPRHFCKGCRRYWTKGGVLRNVPVGGGCRKTKRSSRPKSSESLPVVQPKSSSNSSSESSSLTATTTTTTAVATEAVSASSSRSPPTGFLNIQEYMNPSQGFDHEILEESTNCGFFSGIGNFTSLINSSNDDQLSFRFDNLLDPQNQWPQSAEVAGSGAAVVELKAQHPSAAEAAPTFLDEDDVKVKFSPAPETQPSCTSIFGPSDWQPSSDQGLFDLPNAVDHGYNWSQPNPWTDGDHPSYIP